MWEAPGMYVEAPKGSGVEWFFLDVGRKDSPQPPMLLLHGMPSYSYVWREVLPGLAAAGRRAIAVDLPGWGNSTMLQVGAGFDYTLEEYVDALDSLVTRLELRGQPLELVAPGLLGGTVGALWAARHPEAVAKLTLVNVPLGADAGELPKCLKPLTNPFTASIFCQNPLNVVGKPIEGAGRSFRSFPLAPGVRSASRRHARKCAAWPGGSDKKRRRTVMYVVMWVGSLRGHAPRARKPSLASPPKATSREVCGGRGMCVKTEAC